MRDLARSFRLSGVTDRYRVFRTADVEAHFSIFLPGLSPFPRSSFYSRTPISAA